MYKKECPLWGAVLRLYVPDLGQECGKVFVFDFEGEAHFEIGVAETSKFRQHCQQPGEFLRLFQCVIVYVSFQSVYVDLLYFFNFFRLH